MAPIGEAGAGAGADAAAGAADEAAAASAGAAGAGKKGSYVPPALRGAGAGAAAGERMGGKYGERDDLATLRVTNVRFFLVLWRTGRRKRWKSRIGGRAARLLYYLFLRRGYYDGIMHANMLFFTLGLRDGRGTRASRYVRAVRSCHPCLPCQGSRHGSRQGFRFHQFRGSQRRCQGLRQDGRFWFQAFDPQGRVREEGCVNRWFSLRWRRRLRMRSVEGSENLRCYGSYNAVCY